MGGRRQVPVTGVAAVILRRLRELHFAGPTVHVPEFKVLAEFGVLFLLFSTGLNCSLPQLHAMRHQSSASVRRRVHWPLLSWPRRRGWLA